jgi:hypothetical protein
MPEPPDDSNEGLLHEVLCLAAVARQHVGEPSGGRHVTLVEVGDLPAGALHIPVFGHEGSPHYVRRARATGGVVPGRIPAACW